MNSGSSKDQESPIISKKALFWNRVQLIMILVVFTAPIAGAFLYQPDSSGNYGDLFVPVRVVPNIKMQPVELTETGMQESAETVDMDSLRRQWVFLVVAKDECSQSCEDNILKIRQMRFMQNNDMSRIRTVFLHTGIPEARAQDLNAKYHPMEVYSVEPQAFDEWTQILWLENVPSQANENRFYVIDPAGNLMMSYPATADPSYIKKDIKRLLKTSQIG